ncbi:hypothetical protein P3T76_015251 [Phytophthora citrophthora]|uniref:MULE transposase domain-containing protein n=1 Tax=Phytophthora citrophthora TaxID=4793 RepID=A0AAD9FZS4_9STRA|nr:hypothetical protein P3T76_015251 [Phytophthora citrophthora]
MKDVMKEWASRGLKPKRIRDALLQRFGLTVATVPKLTTVQRFVHHHVTGRLGGSDLIETVKTKVKEAGYTGQDEETAAFTFTSCTDGDGRPVTGKGSDVDPFVVGITSKNLLCRADQDPATFILHIDATYKLTQVVYPVVVVGMSTELANSTYWRCLSSRSTSSSTTPRCSGCCDRCTAVLPGSQCAFGT